MARQTVRINRFGGYNKNISNDMAYADIASGFTVTESGSVKKGPGFSEFLTATQSLGKLWSGEIGLTRILAYTSGTSLCAYDFNTHTVSVIGSVGSNASMFGFGGFLYILTDSGYYKYDGTNLTSVEGYIPIIAVSTTPAGDGTVFESVNMLTAKRRQRFSSDGTSVIYQLAEKEIHSVISVTNGGTAIAPADYTVDATNGTVTFNSAPVSGLNNVEITYELSQSNRGTVLGCKHCMLFGPNSDTRVFLWGNPTEKSYRYHSELADGAPSAEYFPVDCYTVIGNTELTDIIQQYDKQLIFTRNNAFYSYCELKENSNGEVYTSFPVYPLNPVKGSKLSGSGCSMDGMPVTFCDDGINIWTATDVENEKNAVSISEQISDLISVQMSSPTVSGKLVNDIANGRLIFYSLGNYYIYTKAAKSWTYRTGPYATDIITVGKDVYVAGSDKKIYTLSETENGFNAEYTTKQSDFGLSNTFDVKSVTLSLKGGAATNGSLAVNCLCGSDLLTRTHAFSVPLSDAERLIKVSIPVYIPCADSMSVSITSGIGKRLEIAEMEIEIIKRGSIAYGV